MQYKDINDYEVLYLIGENQLEEKDIIFKKYKPILISISQKYYMRLRDDRDKGWQRICAPGRPRRRTPDRNKLWRTTKSS